jgi:hypothetical protein
VHFYQPTYHGRRLCYIPPHRDYHIATSLQLQLPLSLPQAMDAPNEPKMQVLDFASPASSSSPSSRPELGAERLHIDTRMESAPQSPDQLRVADQSSAVEGQFSPSRFSVDSTLRRRPTRSNTVRRYHSPTRPQWEEPGAEPGIDTQKETATSDYSHLHQQCDITVVDFSDERCQTFELDNGTLEEFLSKPQEPWTQCRWINVNGLSWDVIRVLGNYKQLHSLAIEDLMNTRGRTKADWYSDQAFCTCNISKLFIVHVSSHYDQQCAGHASS